MDMSAVTAVCREMTELEKSQEEIKILRERLREYEQKFDCYRDSEERAYMRGRIEGLEFSIRCNGVSGNEVGK